MEPIKDNLASSFNPESWTDETVRDIALSESIRLSDDHLSVLHALQEYSSRHEIKHINVRELHDALDEKFHHNGGMKYVCSLFPGGLIAQGCRLAGLKPPAGAADKGFGSVI